MSMLPDGFRRLFRLPPSPARVRQQVARDVDDEIGFHLALKAEALRAQGLAPEEAERLARERFGDVERLRAEVRTIDEELVRAERRSALLETAWQDARVAARGLRRAPAFAVAALLTLALGIGATTVVSSAVYATLIRPLPYADAGRLVYLWETSTTTAGARNPVSVPNYLDWARESRSFVSTLAYAFNRFTVTGGDAPEQIQGSQILGDLARTLGVRPMLGRTIEPRDAREHVVVLSEGLWRRRYGADPAALGRAIVMNDVPYTVIGVMPSSFEFPRRGVELWTAYATILSDPAWGEARGRRFQRVVGRLGPGVTPEAARREIDAIAHRLSVAFPDANPGGGATAVPLREQLTGDVRPALLLLLGAAACVLLIACANVAHLVLARTAAREGELAVRAALGAGRGRVVRQLLTENLVLAALGAAAGVGLAHLAAAALRRLSPQDSPLHDVRVGGTALAFAAAVALVSAVLVGVAPAVRAARGALAERLRAGARAGHDRRQHATQAALVTVEVAVSLVLLVGAGLLLQSFARVRAVDPGVEPEGVASMLVIASPTRYETAEQQRAVFDEVVSRVAAVPGVRAVGLCDCMPPNEVRQGGSVLIEGIERAPDELPVVQQIRAGASFFAALGIPVLAGRAFTPADRADAPLVAVVNEAFARRLLGAGGRGEAAVGRRIAMVEGRWLTIVGVVGDVRYDGLATPASPAMYSAFAQDPLNGLYLFVRAAGDPLALIPAVRRAVLSVDPAMPLAYVQRLEAGIAESTATERLNSALLGGFAGLAFVLVAVGIYGAVAYRVAHDRRSVAVRMALGARPADVLRLVIGRALRPVAVGLALGIAAAVVLSGSVERMLYGVTAHDPETYLGVTALLLLVGAAAAYLPGRRAAGADPAALLRAE
ncbi:MAG: ADOP family duplicated permease [Gemmatimonadaceae bacterium]